MVNKTFIGPIYISGDPNPFKCHVHMFNKQLGKQLGCIHHHLFFLVEMMPHDSSHDIIMTSRDLPKNQRLHPPKTEGVKKRTCFFLPGGVSLGYLRFFQKLLQAAPRKQL